MACAKDQAEKQLADFERGYRDEQKSDQEDEAVVPSRNTKRR